MNHFCTARRFPRAGVDSITQPELAAAMITSFMSSPASAEVFALLLDHERRGISVLHVVDAVHPDAVFDVADVVVAHAHARTDFGAVILATVRPDASSDCVASRWQGIPRESTCCDCAGCCGLDQLDDADRWVELSDRFDDVGLELVEWFVIGRTTTLPRALAGDGPRWEP